MTKWIYICNVWCLVYLSEPDSGWLCLPHPHMDGENRAGKPCCEEFSHLQLAAPKTHCWCGWSRNKKDEGSLRNTSEATMDHKLRKHHHLLWDHVLWWLDHGFWPNRTSGRLKHFVYIKQLLAPWPNQMFANTPAAHVWRVASSPKVASHPILGAHHNPEPSP